jgi:hypothetical protein
MVVRGERRLDFRNRRIAGCGAVAVAVGMDDDIDEVGISKLTAVRSKVASSKHQVATTAP